MKTDDPKTIVFSVKTVDGNRYYFEREYQFEGYSDLTEDLYDKDLEWVRIEDGGMTRLFLKNNIVCITRKEKM